MPLNDEQIDALKEIINIGIGRAAATLNELLSSRVILQIPSVRAFKHIDFVEKIKSDGSAKLSVVNLGFQGALTGIALITFPPGMAVNLVSVVTDEDFDVIDFDSVRIATLSEIGNIVLSGIMGYMGNLIDERIEFTLPRYREDYLENLLLSVEKNSDDLIIVMQTHFSIEEHQIEGDIMILFEVVSLEALHSIIDIH